MLATFLLLVSLSQDSAPLPFSWGIEGMGEPKSQKVVTVWPTPLALVSGLDVKTINLDPLPTREDLKPHAISPLKTEPAPKWGLRAWFAPPGRRFHLRVTLSDGSIHKIDIYRQAPRPEKPEPKIYKAIPRHLIAPRGMWTTHWSGTGNPGTSPRCVFQYPLVLGAHRLRQLFRVRPAAAQSTAVVKNDHELAVKGGLQLSDAIDVDDDRTMDAREA